MMMKTTVQLRHLLQTDFELFDFDYNFDDPLMKERIEQSIIDYYYFHEINGTPDRFKHRFKTHFLRMIDYYNQLHNTTLLKYNPLTNYSMEEALEQLSSSSNTRDSKGDSHSYSDSQLKESDYPQQPIAGGDYLSGASNSVVDTSTEDNVTVTDNGQSNTNYTKTIEGITGITYQELIQKERDNLIRLTNMIIEELKPCFLLVY